MHVLAQSAPSFFRCTLILGVIGNNSTFVYGVFLVGFVVSLTILEGAPSISNPKAAPVIYSSALAPFLPRRVIKCDETIKCDIRTYKGADRQT